MAVAYLQPRDYVAQVAPDSGVYSEAEALAYTRWLATHHYENFHVASFLLPKHLHQDFYNVYAFCRWADDLGDEIGDREQSLRLLAWWRSELQALYGEAIIQAPSGPALNRDREGADAFHRAGGNSNALHPVFVALRSTVRKFEIPMEPFERLIQAFEQDQRITRYETWGDVLSYCVNSANPVGHLVLYLCGYRDEERQRLSDYTCTALQLANFWQDVTVDMTKDRVYLPLSLLRKHRFTVEELFARRFDERFECVMREAVDVAQDLFERGVPLIGTVDRRLALDLELFSRGGMHVLQKIREQSYNVLGMRPAISKWERAGILFRCLPRLIVR